MKELELGGATIYFGGVAPDVKSDPRARAHFPSLLGSIRGITTSNPGKKSQKQGQKFFIRT